MRTLFDIERQNLTW